MTPALVKAFLGALAAMALAGCLWVFEASSATAIALGLTEDARQTESEFVRAQLLDRGARTLRDNWAAPLAWHAGAAEIMSAIAYMQGETEGEEAYFRASAHYAARAVSLAPVQPHAFIRLAALAERGVANPVCGLRACIERAFVDARMLEPDAACARLQLGVRAGLLTPDDPRVDDYLHTALSRRSAAQCLGVVFPPDIVFHLAMQAGPAR